MIRRPRLWTKKRGSRLSGWQGWGTVGETIFYATLFLLGAFGCGIIVATLTLTTEQSPVSPGFGFWTLLIASVSLSVVGITGAVYRIVNVGASHERRSALAKRASELDLVPKSGSELPNVPQFKKLTNSPGSELAYRLPTVSSPVWNLMASTMLAFLWNGCALSLLAVAIVSILEGRPRYLLILLIAPIMVAGIWTFRRFIDQLKQWTGVGASIVEISNHPLQPGQTCEVYVSQSGRMSLKSLLVELVCEEESTFCQGTDVRIEKQQVFQEIVFQDKRLSIDPSKPWEQKFTIVIPPSAMHSFKSPHNAVSWWIVIRGEASPWPSFFRRFPVVVYPHDVAPATNP